jgi:hypothetical protein
MSRVNTNTPRPKLWADDRQEYCPLSVILMDREVEFVEENEKEDLPRGYDVGTNKEVHQSRLFWGRPASPLGLPFFLEGGGRLVASRSSPLGIGELPGAEAGPIPPPPPPPPPRSCAARQRVWPSERGRTGANPGGGPELLCWCTAIAGPPAICAPQAREREAGRRRGEGQGPREGEGGGYIR